MELPPPPSSRRRSSRHSRRRRRKARWRIEVDWQWWLPLGIFAGMAVLAPLLFGAVDRVVQVLLVLLLTLGTVILPPVWPRLSQASRWLLAVGIAMFLTKEFAPASWFGHVSWREELQVPLPWTHHPEPARALDALFVAVVAMVWFQWVRTLAASGHRRVWMAWILGGAGVVLAMVCFLMKPNPARPTAIFGLRETEGWVGWGTFPNRNHTSSFLAMGALVLCGCTWWAFAKRKKVLGAAAALALAVTIGALLAGKSRGGLLAFGTGLCTFLALVMWRRRDRQSVIVSLAVVAVAAAALVTFGAKVLERFSSAAGNVSTDTRLLIWHEAARMWKDAPIFGHGVETFSQLFPMYLRADLDGKTVLHPESSWLQWLAELGAVPVLLLVSVLGWFVIRQLRGAWMQRRNFLLTAGLFAGALALLAHALIDVPGHRWATAGFALALLAVAFPMVEPGPGAEPLPASRGVVLLPAGIGGLWLLPFLGVVWPWSVMAPTMLLNRETRGGQRPTLAEWEAALRWFPLDPWLREFAGERALEAKAQDRARWERDFAAVRRLAGAAFWLPERQARAVGKKFPAEALPLWQEAIERSGRQWSEMLRSAVRATARVRGARVLWAQYVEANPRLALTYAQVLTSELKAPEADVRAFFDIWWEQCAMGEITDEEAAVYYGYAARWSNLTQLEAWMRAHAQRRRKDYAAWATLLHGWKKDERAWQVYSGAISPPEPLPPPKGATREMLTDKVRATGNNSIFVLDLAHLLEAQGDQAGATHVLVEAAGRSDAPARVLREAAYRLAAEGHYREAVEVALREKPGAK